MSDDSQGLLSQDAYLEVTIEETISITFNNSTHKIIRAAGSWVDDGVLPGMSVEIDDATNPGPFLVTAVSATDITTSDTLVTNATPAALALTFFAKVGEVVSLTTPAGEPSEIAMTHLRSRAHEFRNGLRDEGSISGEMNFVPSDPGQIILTQMQGEKLGRKCRIVMPPVDEGAYTLDGYQWDFKGLARGMPVSLAVDSKATRAFTIRVSGEVTETTLQPE